ncbi:hypothetical protein ACIA98_41705 [Streptomyces sp. NPDC051366]|uniref:hypothetical protein n=1 Tax=Streptomyces sp. NPDC051366 TaxID=3365652 RepID=UPI00378B880F
MRPRTVLVTLYDGVEALDVTTAQAVRGFLERQARNWTARNPNNWQSALYRALAVDLWYMAGGFREVS